jgi:hypothetical protein
METTTRELERRLAIVERRMRMTWAMAFVAGVSVLAWGRQPVAQAQKNGGGNPIEARVSALETKTQYLSTGTDANNKPALFITGANVYIQDGSGSTDSGIESGGAGTGLGNLTIGYNARRDYWEYPDVRTGSHSLILGDFNNYSSYGGLVAGYWNTISGRYALVSGGRLNKAIGDYASVTGGIVNTASGNFASVRGGYWNTASGPYASVSGGWDNRATGERASVAGGGSNLAMGHAASVSGGWQRSALSSSDWAAGSLSEDW